jgi:hypothetical protein
VISVADRLNSKPEMDKDELASDTEALDGTAAEAAVSGSSAKTGTQND